MKKLYYLILVAIIFSCSENKIFKTVEDSLSDTWKKEGNSGCLSDDFIELLYNKTYIYQGWENKCDDKEVDIYGSWDFNKDSLTLKFRYNNTIEHYKIKTITDDILELEDTSKTYIYRRFTPPKPKN